MKRKNEFLSKEVWESIWLISREISVNQFYNWILRRMAYGVPLRSWTQSTVHSTVACIILYIHTLPYFHRLSADYSKPHSDNFGIFMRRLAFALPSTFLCAVVTPYAHPYRPLHTISKIIHTLFFWFINLFHTLLSLLVYIFFHSPFYLS